ncbi:MAG: hypothetical protein IPH44_33880 [Myxococcales bacterium]|nr:hypothetical protein [Myxococcales bacterium]MBK7192685.1 hypothetical protein [Myxococcales bacterium]MBP6846953.1 hypothetical protein [Kofleriaceae bacterium]
MMSTGSPDSNLPATGHPYREAHAPVGEPARDDEALLALDVSGLPGEPAEHGRDGERGHAARGPGQPGGAGQPGWHAGPAQVGQHAGEIRLTLTASGDGMITVRGSTMPPHRPRQPIDETRYAGEHGSIVLRAVGGDGGRGGNGGRGGDGGRGAHGRDATSTSRGTDGAPGGPGGTGGDATSGGAGGRGGTVIVSVDARDTALLMLVEHAVAGGRGGAPGRNGRGGDGGAGGTGGSSYAWTETDSDGDSRHCSNAGGSTGRTGPRGPAGNAAVVEGALGPEGRFAIEVTGGEAAAPSTYGGRFDLHLCHFVHVDASVDDIYEPGEEVSLRAIQVENAGAMPMPALGQVAVQLAATAWHTPCSAPLMAPGGIGAGDVVTLDGELRTRLADRPAAVGAPLAEPMTLLPEAWVTSVRRPFVGFADGAATFGQFVLQWPAQLAEPTHLRALAAGEVTRVRVAVTNVSSRTLGRASPDGRVLRLRVRTAPESDLGDDVVALRAGAFEFAPSTGWLHELEQLEERATTTVEFELVIHERAPAYLQWRGEVTLELSHAADRDDVRPIQTRSIEVRVALRFTPDDADLLLVVNHRTSRGALAAWEATARQVMAHLAVWDLSREQHLDLDRPLAGGRSLAEHFAGKAIVILDNVFDGPDGPIRANAYLCPDQLRRCAAAGIEVAFLGGPLDLRAQLIPPPKPTADLALVATSAEASASLRHSSQTRMTVEHATRWPWWRPSREWLAARAQALSAQLARALPDQRHIVIYRFAPKLLAQRWTGGRWFVGTIETRRTLDPTAVSVVHVEVSDAVAGDLDTILAGTPRLAVLTMLDVAQQLERLRWVLARPMPEPAVLTDLCDALLATLTSEVAAALTPGRVLPRDLGQAFPRLAAVAARSGTAILEGRAGGALIAFAASLWHVVRCQVAWYERLPPWRWLSRSRRVHAHVRDALTAWIGHVFGDSMVAAAWDQIEQQADDLLATMRRRQFWWADRRTGGLAHGRRALDTPGLTADTELLGTAADRVVDGDTADALAQAARDAAARRAELMRAGAAARATHEIAPASPKGAS